MRPQGYDKEDLQNALNVLNEGGIILYPTDTIWGIGCDANNSEAVQRIYDIKQRSDSKSMLVLVNSINMVERYIDELPEVANDLLEVTDKPLTIIYDNAKNLAKNLIAEDGSIGIRVTDELFSNHLITRFKRPIVSTSANVSGKNAELGSQDKWNERLTCAWNIFTAQLKKIKLFSEENLVGICSFYKNSHPNILETPQYQLRGMAVLMPFQNKSLKKGVVVFFQDLHTS